MSDLSHLDRIVELERENESYEFDLFGVFYDPSLRRYYTATDAGCSCPEAWEDHEIELVGPLTFVAARALLDAEGMTHKNRNEGWFADAYRSSRDRLTAHAEENGLTEV